MPEAFFGEDGLAKRKEVSDTWSVPLAKGLSLAAAYAIYKKNFPDAAEEEVGHLGDDKVGQASDIIKETQDRLAEERKPPDLKESPGQASSDIRDRSTSFLGRITNWWKALTGDGYTSSAPSTEEHRTPSTATLRRSSLSTNLLSNYRTSAKFHGFATAESISKNGTFTASEAARVQSLKTSGANTAAFASVPTDIERLIRYHATQQGVDPDLALKVARMESGGNPNAISSTGAIGVYQFTGRTATSIGIADRFDPEQNVEGGILLLKKNAEVLVRSNVAVTSTALYLSHQLGPAAAKEVIEAAVQNKSISQLSRSTQAAIRRNYGGKSAKTSAGYIAVTEAKLNAPSTSSAEDPALASVSTPPISSVSVRSTDSQPTAAVAEATVDAEDQTTAERTSGAIRTVAPPVGGKLSKTERANKKDFPVQTVVRAPNGILVALHD